jgi:hypothetical protein
MDGFLLAGIGPHATAAKGRAKVGVVNSDNRFQTGGFVAGKDDLFMVIKGDIGKDVHPLQPPGSIIFSGAGCFLLIPLCLLHQPIDQFLIPAIQKKDRFG